MVVETILAAIFAPPALLAVAAGIAAGGLWLLNKGLLRAALVAATFAAFGVAAAAAPPLAETLEGLVAQAQSRTKAQTPSAQALFEATQGRHEPFMAQAQALVDASPAQVRRGFSGLESSEFAGGSGLAQLGDPSPPEGVVYVAVSFSQPPADLRRLGQDAQKAGAVLVIRGLVRGSFKETLLAARQVFDEGSLGGVAIDPNVFRAFDIQAVPTFIAATRPVQPCTKGLECVPAAPAHDRVSGNISLGEALRLLKANGAAATDAAAAASDRLGG